MILLEYQNMNIFLQKVKLQIGLKKFLWLQKSKVLHCGHMLLMILMEKELLELFMKNNWKKKLTKVIETKGDKLYVK